MYKFKNPLIHPLLEFDSERDHPDTVQPGLIWDVGEKPTRALVASSQRDTISRSVMRKQGFDPEVTYMRITSTHFPPDFDWYVDVTNPYGVGIGDILESVHTFLRSRISPSEWSRTTPRQQARVTKTFYARVNGAHPDASRQELTRGIIRADWLLGQTQFVGLAPSYERPNTWNVITRHAPRRTRRH